MQESCSSVSSTYFYNGTHCIQLKTALFALLEYKSLVVELYI